MKKILCSIGIFSLLSTSLFAQVPEMESKSVVWKFTETWCGPCGTWGWDLANEILNDIGDKGYYVGVMGSSTPTSMNANCYDAFVNNFEVAGYPTFTVNNTESGTSISSVKSKYDAFAASTPVASSAGIFEIVGNEILVNANTKFWSDADGNYFLAAYIVEDKVVATQYGQSGNVEHHHLMRGTMMSNNSPWGQTVASGSISANSEYPHTFSKTFDANAWNKDNIEIILVLYKYDGNTYNVVNSTKAKPGATHIEKISGVENLSLYPNPAKGKFNMSIKSNRAFPASVEIFDISGRLVKQQNDIMINSGSNNIDINVADLKHGMHNVVIKTDNSFMVKQIVIGE